MVRSSSAPTIHLPVLWYRVFEKAHCRLQEESREHPATRAATTAEATPTCKATSTAKQETEQATASTAKPATVETEAATAERRGNGRRGAALPLQQMRGQEHD